MSLLERLPQAVRHEGGLSRRLFVAYGAALAALPAIAARSAGTTDSKISFAADPFQLGVASGDPDAHSVVLWTRLCPKPLEPGYGLTTERVSVRWELSETESMSRIVQRGTALARRVCVRRADDAARACAAQAQT
jgi:alkaline phosphatase D